MSERVQLRSGAGAGQEQDLGQQGCLYPIPEHPEQPSEGSSFWGAHSRREVAPGGSMVAVLAGRWPLTCSPLLRLCGFCVCWLWLRESWLRGSPGHFLKRTQEKTMRKLALK